MWCFLVGIFFLWFCKTDAASVCKSELWKGRTGRVFLCLYVLCLVTNARVAGLFLFILMECWAGVPGLFALPSSRLSITLALGRAAGWGNYSCLLSRGQDNNKQSHAVRYEAKHFTNWDLPGGW